MKHQKNSIRVNQQSEKKEKATENVDIHKQNTHLGNVNIIKTVKVCIGRCSDFEEVPCFRRDRFIGACNGCSEIKSCKKTIYTYIHTYIH